MKKIVGVALLACAIGLSGCADKSRVIFVTSTSLGINVDSKPPVASVGYDRTEGYLGPRAENGGLPPVIGSLATDGKLFDPRVRQVYATGAAAVIASGGDADGPATMQGESEKNELAFFGTTTGLGFKITFGESGVDSFNFGFKRKEFSVIPLSPDPDADDDDDRGAVYPSVLASIDTATTVGATGGGSGLTTQQFFATGLAAEALADDVQMTFTVIAKDALKAALSQEEAEQADAIAKARVERKRINTKLVMDTVAGSGSVDHAKLDPAIDKATLSDSAKATLKQTNDPATLRAFLDDAEVAGALAAALAADTP